MLELAHDLDRRHELALLEHDLGLVAAPRLGSRYQPGLPGRWAASCTSGRSRGRCRRRPWTPVTQRQSHRRARSAAIPRLPPAPITRKEVSVVQIVGASPSIQVLGTGDRLMVLASALSLFWSAAPTSSSTTGLDDRNHSTSICLVGDPPRRRSSRSDDLGPRRWGKGTRRGKRRCSLHAIRPIDIGRGRQNVVAGPGPVATRSAPAAPARPASRCWA